MLLYSQGTVSHIDSWGLVDGQIDMVLILHKSTSRLPVIFSCYIKINNRCHTHRFNGSPTYKPSLCTVVRFTQYMFNALLTGNSRGTNVSVMGLGTLQHCHGENFFILIRYGKGRKSTHSSTDKFLDVISLPLDVI